MPASQKTLFLPYNFPNSQVLYNYVFGYNETHMGLVLDYGSGLNHHESANVEVANVEVGEEFPGRSGDVNFYVRMGFQCANRNALKICSIHACTHTQRHTYTTETRTHKHFLGHKIHRGWTGNFCSVWRWGVV